MPEKYVDKPYMIARERNSELSGARRHVVSRALRALQPLLTSEIFLLCEAGTVET